MKFAQSAVLLDIVVATAAAPGTQITPAPLNAKEVIKRAICSGPCDSAIAAVPTCGTSCIASAASAVGCTPGDNACPCSSSQNAAIQSIAQNCVISACGINNAIALQASAAAVCSCISANPSSACASTTAIAISGSSDSSAPAQ